MNEWNIWCMLFTTFILTLLILAKANDNDDDGGDDNVDVFNQSSLFSIICSEMHEKLIGHLTDALQPKY